MASDPSAQKDIGIPAGLQRERLPVWEFYAGTGDHEETFPHLMRELCFTNDGSGDIDVQVVGPADLNITITLKGGEVLDERFPPFSGVAIVGPGQEWRFYTRSPVTV